MPVDLHIHTTASDGTMTPGEVVKLAASSGLSAIAITDHDTLDGVGPATDEGRSAGVEVIPGVELSCTFANKDVHILGYFVSVNDEKIQDHLQNLRSERRKRASDMVSAMREDGIDISMDELSELANGGSIGRLHLAKLLVKKGIACDVDQAFSDLIGRRSKYFISKPVRDPEQVVALIRSSGGLAVLAHPMMLHDDKLVNELVGIGLDGIEVFHSDHSRREEAFYVQAAKKAGLVMTGGSDFHGLTEKRGHADALTSLPDLILTELKNAKARL